VVPVATPDLILIGLRGSGKSVIGRAVGSRLGRAFIDLDDLTPGILGFPTVGSAWAAAGEPGFRLAELEALRQVLQQRRPAGRIISLGGGTPTAPGAALALNNARRANAAFVIYLRADAPTLRSRLAGGDHANRPPLLPSGDALSEIEAVLNRRDAMYAGLADVVLTTDGLTLEQAIDAVIAAAP
jgi:shikimate kinase